MADPLRTLWDALETQGWDPQGPEHKFRANCPAHEGDSHQLRVNEGLDGRALVYCHTRHCSPREIVNALGLRMSDLFPPGHDQARALPQPEPPPPRRPVAELAALLSLLDEVGEPWQAMVEVRCQFCHEPGGWVRVHSDKNKNLHVDCPHGCSNRAFEQGLAGRVEIARIDAAQTRSRKAMP